MFAGIERQNPIHLTRRIVVDDFVCKKLQRCKLFPKGVISQIRSRRSYGKRLDGPLRFEFSIPIEGLYKVPVGAIGQSAITDDVAQDGMILRRQWLVTNDALAFENLAHVPEIQRP